MLAGWAVALFGVMLLSGGVALGAARGDGARFTARADAPATRVASTALEAVIVGRRGENFIARTAGGEMLVIHTDAKTKFRLKGDAADQSVVRRGARVIVIGRPAGAGALRARVIAVRRPARSPTQPPDAVAPSQQ